VTQDEDRQLSRFSINRDKLLAFRRSSRRLILFLLIFTYRYAYSFGIDSIDAIKKDDRILVLVPHPDDETIGCAGIIQEALKIGTQVRVVYLTNGDHNQISFVVFEKRLTFRKGEFIHMGQVRRSEATKAMKLLGLDERNLTFLGYPDFGTFAIFSKYWLNSKPYRSRLTRISRVPYKNDLSFGAPYKGENILADLENILLDYQPNKIFVSHPADVNVDHKALYLFLQIALHDLEKKIPKPTVYPYLIHCVDWPLPRHYHPDLSLEPPKKFSNSQINWLKFQLTPAQLNKKYQSIFCYKSQTQSSAFYLLSFARKNELFGSYPEINIKKQASVKNHNISFFGFSGMFTDSTDGLKDNSRDSARDRGRVVYGIKDSSLVIYIDKAKKLNRRLNVMLYLFGYSYKIPFAQMPKIRIVTLYNRFKVFDGSKLIKPKGINLNINSEGLILTIPLEILGEPDYIITSVKAYTGVSPVDVIGFRQITIR
jgi:LmbE family N-acetylglucosaminyl deacetylase